MTVEEIVNMLKRRLRASEIAYEDLCDSKGNYNFNPEVIRLDEQIYVYKHLLVDICGFQEVN